MEKVLAGKHFFQSTGHILRATMMDPPFAARPNLSWAAHLCHIFTHISLTWPNCKKKLKVMSKDSWRLKRIKKKIRREDGRRTRLARSSFWGKPAIFLPPPSPFDFSDGGGGGNSTKKPALDTAEPTRTLKRLMTFVWSNFNRWTWPHHCFLAACSSALLYLRRSSGLRPVLHNGGVGRCLHHCGSGIHL